MSGTGPCKECSISIDVDPEDIEDTLQYLQETRQVVLADDATSGARLAQCMSCPAYVYDSTCKYSGGLVRIKTRIQSERCPYPSNPKWQ